MTTPLWVLELAAEFWQRAGAPGPFPRDLRPSVHRATPLSVKVLEGLNVQRVRTWLGKQRVACVVPAGDRALRACLFARDSWGVVFLDADDPETEHRFSLAHEIGHFLRHYWQPRRRAVAHFGEGILDVFDGKRPPTPTERLHALLRNVRVGAHLHLLGRDDRRRAVSGAIAAAEEEADRLGCELLAPTELLTRVRSRSTREARQEVERQLIATFGFPRPEAAAHACRLYPPLGDPLLRRLGISS